MVSDRWAVVSGQTLVRGFSHWALDREFWTLNLGKSDFGRKEW